MPRVLACELGSPGAVKVAVTAALSHLDVEIKAADQLRYTDSDASIHLSSANAVARLLCELLTRGFRV